MLDFTNACDASRINDYFRHQTFADTRSYYKTGLDTHVMTVKLDTCLDVCDHVAEPRSGAFKY